MCVIPSAFDAFCDKHQHCNPNHNQKHRNYDIPYRSSFSGRGVGLDVVNAAVASLGGSIRIESREYMGTTFFMEFPVVDEMHAEG